MPTRQQRSVGLFLGCTAAARAFSGHLEFELDAHGCIVNYDASVDYFTADRRAIFTGSAGIVPTTVTDAQDFSIEYKRTYKVLRNLRTGHVYVLHQCGAPNVLDDLPADAVNASVFSVPVPAWVTGSTIPISFAEALGVGPKAVLTNMQYVSAPCWQKRAACTDATLASVDNYNQALWRQSAINSSATVVFTDAYGTGASGSAKDVAFDATGDPGLMARVEWLKFQAAFFNLEPEANRVYDGIKSRFDANAAAVTAVRRAGGGGLKLGYIEYYSWSSPAQYRLDVTPYKVEALTTAGAVSPDLTAVAAICPLSGVKYVCTSSETFKEVLKMLDAVIDSTYAYSPPSYDIAAFKANFNLTLEPESDYPFFGRGLVLTKDKSLKSVGGGYGNNFLEDGTLDADIYVKDITKYVTPTAVEAGYVTKFVRNIAAAEAPVLVTAAQCVDPYSVCPNEVTPPAPPAVLNYCIDNICLIAAPPSPPGYVGTSPPPPTPAPEEKLADWATGVIIGVACLAAWCGFLLMLVISRERSGNPMFASVDVVKTPAQTTTSASYASAGADNSSM